MQKNKHFCVFEILGHQDPPLLKTEIADDHQTMTCDLTSSVFLTLK